MKILQKLSILISAAIITAAVPIAASAMSTQDFDNGMAKGINYFNRGLYYEAKDEFQWFCDANWGNMNSGQQQYALDYLGGTKAKIRSLYRVQLILGGKSLYGATYHIDADTAKKVIKEVYNINAKYTGRGNAIITLEGGGYEFYVNIWYSKPTASIDEIFNHISLKY